MDEPYEIQFRGDHLHVELRASYHPEPDRQNVLWDLVRSECEANKTTRVLVEGVIPAADRSPVDVVAAGKKTALIPHLWLAFNFDDFVETENTQLFETIATSTGARAKFFTDSEKALKWLRSNAPA